MTQDNEDGMTTLKISGEYVIDARPEATEDKRADECLLIIDEWEFRFPRESADELTRLIPRLVEHVMSRLRAALAR